MSNKKRKEHIRNIKKEIEKNKMRSEIPKSFFLIEIPPNLLKWLIIGFIILIIGYIKVK